MKSTFDEFEEDYEVKLWITLSLVDNDPYLSIKSKLRELNKSGYKPERYIEFANSIFAYKDQQACMSELAEILAGSKPEFEKIKDCSYFRSMREIIQPRSIEKLDDFYDKCLKA